MSNRQEETNTYQLDDDIYIDCRPVNIIGEVIDDEKETVTSKTNNQIINEAADFIDGGKILDNIAFQTILGLTLMAILYSIGNYVFKEFPKKILESD